MILGRHGEVRLAGLDRQALRHRPGFEHSVQLEAKVEVKLASGVLLDHEEQGTGALRDRLRGRFRRCFE